MIDLSLLKHLPAVRRSRFDRLYGPAEQYWIDCWKEGGAWLFGRRVDRAALGWKQHLDKGLAALLPSRGQQRLGRHLKELFPLMERHWVFRNADRARTALAWLTDRPWSFQDWKSCLWRPYDPRPQQPRSSALAGLLWPVLPSGPAQAVVLVMTAECPLLAHAKALESLNDVISPAEASALIGAVVSLIADQRQPRAQMQRQQVQIAFDQTVGPLGLFQRVGSYFEPLCSPEDYERLFLIFLKAGFVLSPDLDQESILPTTMSAGEWKAFRAAAELFLQGETAWNS